jgi:hypothetical protein
MVPRCQDGRIFSLADCFYTASTKAGDIILNETVDGPTSGVHIAGTILHIEHIDDRWGDGKPNRQALPHLRDQMQRELART